MESLLAHVQKFIPLTDALAAHLQLICKPIHIDKGGFVHQPGRVCNSTYFIESGLVRTYYQKDDKEITDTFSAEGEWTTSVQSFLTNIPDNFYVQALEPSGLIGITFDQLEQCFAQFPEMERFGRILMSKNFIAQSERIISLQFHSARERYDFFAATSPAIMHRVPLGMLASHLGMTQETLSRIRSGRVAF